MPSLRKKVSTYLRQLSFHNEPRDKRHNINENSFITKYLQGFVSLRDGPSIMYGKNATDLPNYELGEYERGPGTIVGCYTGPRGGLTTVKRTEKHLSVPDQDIDFIDTPEETTVVPPVTPKKSPLKIGGAIDNTSMVIKVAGQEYCVTNRTKKHCKSHSLGSIQDFNIEIETTRIDKRFYDNNNKSDKQNQTETVAEAAAGVNLENGDGAKGKQTNDGSRRKRNHGNGIRGQHGYDLSKSKSEGNPFQNKKRGKIIKVVNRSDVSAEPDRNAASNYDARIPTEDRSLPSDWSLRSELTYGISDSLYDRNQVTNRRNGDPIADCFGLITRGNSAILAVADGVNWGEKASIAAKSAVHGCLHYLNKTLFSDTKPFDALTTSTTTPQEAAVTNRVGSSRDVFVALLRAFNCAHDLILENNGMLTTLTVAVVMPLKKRDEHVQRYVCCVCNVGDTLAYIYSQRHGLREMTKGSHDVNCNRDMRDALGALGPVDGINPELSNLTLSISTLNKGDIVMVASDGLTDNFDPNVCRFTVNSTLSEIAAKIKKDAGVSATAGPPVKPPRASRLQESGAFSRRQSKSISNRSDSSTTSETKSNLPRRPPPVDAVRGGNHASGSKFSRSKTSVDMRTVRTIVRNEDGIPYVTPLQRYELQLLLMEDVLKNGISGKEQPCATAKKLCENLVNFTFSITNAKRQTLEDQELYFDNRNGVMVEVSQQEKKLRRKKGLEKVQNLPGKLDHVTVVAWNVGNAIA